MRRRVGAVATINLTKLSYAELLKLQARLEAALAEKRAAEANATKDQLRAMAEKAGFTVEELFGKRGARRPREAKYRNPNNPSQTWSGRGRKPNWFVDAVKMGAKLESLSV
ncbi:MAG: H-NS histone family protein [Hyphomicrobium sp.]|uniref:H-NS histone family protein n=1 Tax=Hyphomicrobium sp. TaxID=82 RepID=UPI0013278F00|nr:H-NS histone family protein [Hyphomicrobium sp.]KAB2941755.1 MAG: H-NS histone family protein [Hyphomicrobium sp.]MBZ0210288.1 H-NS histone family protein [Hyphomicrobium sp.]